MSKKNENIARISNRGDAMQKSANPSYHKELHANGMVYSIDMIRLNFKLKSPTMLSKIMNDIRDKSMYTTDTPYDYEYYESRAWYKYRHNFTIKMKEEKSFYIAFSLNGDKNKVSHGVIEFNPNKCFGQEVTFFNTGLDEETGEITYKSVYQGDLLNYFLIQLISNNSKSIKLVRFDMAIDIPYPKKQVHLIKDNRMYKMVAPSQNANTYTEYLGQHNNSGFVKVYNKTIESGLDHDVTRLEITSEYGNNYKKFMSQFPEVYVKGNGTLFPYTELKNTDLVLYELLIASSNMERYFKQLGRDKQNKLKPYLFGDQEDIRITVPEQIYNELMKYIHDTCKLRSIGT